MTADKIRKLGEIKRRGDRFVALTTYDFPTTQLLDEAGVDLLLVGDSLGMVVLGYPDTTFVTLSEMEHHVRASARAKPKGLLVGDLPFQTYQTPGEAVLHSERLIAAGAEAVKAEGGRAILPQVNAILSANLPFLGHLGMLPQSVREEGGYHVKGKTEQEEQDLIADALALEAAGAFGIVLELVTPRVATVITRQLKIPTIGIASGPNCDAQILVSSDLFGTSPGHIPRHVQTDRALRNGMIDRVRQWKREVGSL